MRSVVRALPGVVLIGLLAVGSVLPAEAQNCSLRQAAGTYSALATGEIFGFPPDLSFLVGPTVRIGSVETDGEGHVWVRAIASLNGILFGEEYPGVLTVNPDCTSYVTFDIPFPVFGVVPLTFRGVLSDNFKQHDIVMETIGGQPPASTVIISLRRQDRSNCSAADLKGGYLLNMRGKIGLFTPMPTPFARLGRVEFDGKGGFSAKTFYSDVSGPLTSDDFEGTYTVDSACEFSMSYAGGTWAGVLMDNSTAGYVMVSVPDPPSPTDPPAPLGVAVAGTIKKQ